MSNTDVRDEGPVLIGFRYIHALCDDQENTNCQDLSSGPIREPESLDLRTASHYIVSTYHTNSRGKRTVMEKEGNWRWEEKRTKK